jgi:hypothetical protein
MSEVIKIDKKSLTGIFNKALCQKGQSKLLDSIPLRMGKDSITFAKIETQSVAAFGKFNASGFNTYEIKKPMDIIIDLFHVSNLKYVRSDPVSIQLKDGKLHYSAEKDNLGISIQSQEEFNERFWGKNLKMKGVEKNKFPVMSISLKADKFDSDDEKHSPLLAYLIIDIKEFKNIPDCDSVILRGDEDGVYLESIEFGGGVADHQRTLMPKFYVQEEDSFQIRIDKSFWELVISQFTGIINVTVAKRYMMAMETKKGIFFGYMIGVMGEEAVAMDESFIEEIEELDDLVDLEEELEATIKEVAVDKENEDFEVIDSDEEEE